MRAESCCFSKKIVLKIYSWAQLVVAQEQVTCLRRRWIFQLSLKLCSFYFKGNSDFQKSEPGWREKTYGSLCSEKSLDGPEALRNVVFMEFGSWAMRGLFGKFPSGNRGGCVGDTEMQFWGENMLEVKGWHWQLWFLSLKVMQELIWSLETQTLFANTF